MINYFLNFSDLPQIQRICNYLNTLKKRLNHNIIDNKLQNIDEIKNLFIEIYRYANDIKDERLANANCIFEEYVRLFVYLNKYFLLLQKQEYRSSWNVLQDCFDICKFIGRFLGENDRLEIPKTIELLQGYESLYPYKMFCSTELIVDESHCSICGQSMLGLNCSHIKGNLYWGKVATEVITKVREIQAIALVSHPDDKRCILEVKDDTITDEMKFKKLELFLSQGLNCLQIFSIKSKIENQRNLSISKIGRNEKCSCGSGLKFKNCCSHKMYYKHQKNTVSLKEQLTLIYLYSK